jgi:hypothetical protein
LRPSIFFADESSMFIQENPMSLMAGLQVWTCHHIGRSKYGEVVGDFVWA